MYLLHRTCVVHIAKLMSRRGKALEKLVNFHELLEINCAQLFKAQSFVFSSYCSTQQLLAAEHIYVSSILLHKSSHHEKQINLDNLMRSTAEKNAFLMSHPPTLPEWFIVHDIHSKQRKQPIKAIATYAVSQRIEIPVCSKGQ